MSDKYKKQRKKSRAWKHARRWFIHAGRAIKEKVISIPWKDARLWLSLAILATSLFAMATVCSLSVDRLDDAFLDLKSSAVYYWQKVVQRMENPPMEGLTINQLPAIDLQRVCPFSIEDVERKLANWGNTVFSKQTFLRYLAATAEVMSNIALVLPSLMVLLLVIPMLLKSLLFRPSTCRKDSKALVFWKKRITPVLVALKSCLSDFLAFFRAKGFMTVFVILWLINLNIITVVVEFLAWYLHFATGLDFSAAFVSIVRFFIDLIIMLWSAPWWFWAIVGFRIFDIVRRDLGYNLLRHNEAKNAGFFSMLAVVILIVGTMGKGKTTLLTSLGLTGQNYYRRKARELMFKLDMTFPKFPIRRFEDAIEAAYKAGKIHKNRHVKEFVRRKRKQYEQHPSSHRLYGYNVDYDTLVFDDGLKVSRLFDMLESYALLYYLYTIRLPLLISNYSVRSDATLVEKGNFPIWDDDFFERSASDSEQQQEFSHILDMDTMRLGKLMNPNNPFRGSKDIGIVMMTEMGKERGNMLEHKGMKRESEEANPLNDLFNNRIKMDRHAALIENFPFTKIMGDEQREESLGADARELADIVKIKDKSEPKLAMPGYALGNLVYTLFGSKFEDLYYEYRFERGDQTLFGYALKNAFCLFYHHHLRIMNTFGYHVLTLEICDGKSDEQGELFEYYIAYKKDYSNRFKSDGFVDGFEEQSKLTEYGLVDYPQFSGIKSTVKEMKTMDSYFANQLLEQMMHRVLEKLVEEQGGDEKEQNPELSFKLQ